MDRVRIRNEKAQFIKCSAIFSNRIIYRYIGRQSLHENVIVLIDK